MYFETLIGIFLAKKLSYSQKKWYLAYPWYTLLSSIESFQFQQIHATSESWPRDLKFDREYPGKKTGLEFYKEALYQMLFHLEKIEK